MGRGDRLSMWPEARKRTTDNHQGSRKDDKPTNETGGQVKRKTRTTHDPFGRQREKGVGAGQIDPGHQDFV